MNHNSDTASDFYEEIDKLADNLGIDITGIWVWSSERRMLRNKLFDVFEIVTKYFHEQFKGPDKVGCDARTNWTEEYGLGLSLADEFMIGFLPEDGRGPFDELNDFPYDILVRTGLFPEGRDLKWESEFRGRFMIPIRDLQGRVRAFFAMRLNSKGKDDAVMISSPASPIFDKGQIVFNLDQAKKHPDKTAPEPFIITNNPMDVMHCHNRGVLNAVASIGEHMTEDQLLMIRRYKP